MYSYITPIPPFSQSQACQLLGSSLTSFISPLACVETCQAMSAKTPSLPLDTELVLVRSRLFGYAVMGWRSSGSEFLLSGMMSTSLSCFPFPLVVARAPVFFNTVPSLACTILLWDVSISIPLTRRESMIFQWAFLQVLLLLAYLWISNGKCNRSPDGNPMGHIRLHLQDWSPCNRLNTVTLSHVSSGLDDVLSWLELLRRITVLVFHLDGAATVEVPWS